MPIRTTPPATPTAMAMMVERGREAPDDPAWGIWPSKSHNVWTPAWRNLLLCSHAMSKILMHANISCGVLIPQ